MKPHLSEAMPKATEGWACTDSRLRGPSSELPPDSAAHHTRRPPATPVEQG